MRSTQLRLQHLLEGTCGCVYSRPAAGAQHNRRGAPVSAVVSLESGITSLAVRSLAVSLIVTRRGGVVSSVVYLRRRAGLMAPQSPLATSGVLAAS